MWIWQLLAILRHGPARLRVRIRAGTGRSHYDPGPLLVCASVTDEQPRGGTMNNRLLAAGLVALGAVGGAILGVAGASAAKPLWSYHNGNTLMGKSQAYRDGYIIGVIDG
ncbi:MAG: hypothetical protein ACE5H7_18010, partial [Acidiferrobacterales bacterium]